MDNTYLEDTLERLVAATTRLESSIAGMDERQAHVCGHVDRIVATAESQLEVRQLELENKLAEAVTKLAEAEAKLVSLHATSSSNALSGRRTLAAIPEQLLSKHSLNAGGNTEAGVMDEALSGLSLEQRIAVKSQLLRAGFFGQQ